MKCKIYCWNARGEIYLNPVFIFITQVSWRAQREIFACAGGASCSQRCQISVQSTRTAVCATPAAPPSSLSTLQPPAAALGPFQLALLAGCPARWPSSHQESSWRRMEPPCALVHVPESPRCHGRTCRKKRRGGVRGRAAGGGPGAGKRRAPGAGLCWAPAAPSAARFRS